MKTARTEELPCTEATALGEAELLDILSRVTGQPATTKPIGKKAADRKPNDFGVSYRLQLADGIERRRSACTGPSAAEPRLTVADALVHAIKNACKELELPEPVELSGGTAPSTEAEFAPTAAELDYLAEFLERHAAPETVTVEMADAELRARRAAQAEQGGTGGAGTSTGRAAQPSAMALLQQAQVLRAQLCAAERRAERALRHIELCNDELAAHRLPKAARHEQPTSQDHPRVAQGGSNPSGWKTFSGYSRAKYQEQEVKEQDRRAIKIDQSKRDRRRPPPALPPTPLRTRACAPTHASVRHTRSPPSDDRWGQHWRRGIYGALRGWAGGSVGTVIFMLAACARHFDVVNEIGDALGFLPKEQASLPSPPLPFPQPPTSPPPVLPSPACPPWHRLDRPRRASMRWDVRVICSRESSGPRPRSSGRITTPCSLRLLHGARRATLTLTAWSSASRPSWASPRAQGMCTLPPSHDP